MRPIRPVPDDFEIKARARCRAWGKTRELAGEELHEAADMEGLKELEPGCGAQTAENGP
jgi:hypothetical protein